MGSGLMIKKESLIKRVQKFFKNLFHKTEVNYNIKEEMEQNKENTLKIYQDLKSGKISSSDIPSEYLSKVKVLLQEELKIENRRIDELKTEYEMVKYKIKDIT